MSAQTILLDFSIEASRIEDELSLKEVAKKLEKGLMEYFPKLKLIFETSTTDGYYYLYSENQTILLNARFFTHGLITLNIEYFKGEQDQPILSFDVSILIFTIHWEFSQCVIFIQLKNYFYTRENNCQRKKKIRNII